LYRQLPFSRCRHGRWQPYGQPGKGVASERTYAEGVLRYANTFGSVREGKPAQRYGCASQVEYAEGERQYAGRLNTARGIFGSVTPSCHTKAGWHSAGTPYYVARWPCAGRQPCFGSGMPPRALRCVTYHVAKNDYLVPPLKRYAEYACLATSASANRKRHRCGAQVGCRAKAGASRYTSENEAQIDRRRYLRRADAAPAARPGAPSIAGMRCARAAARCKRRVGSR